MGSAELLSLVDWARTGRVPRPVTARRADDLVRAAITQRVAPLLYTAVIGEPEGWPGPALEKLRERHHASFALGATQLDLAARLMSAFEAAGLRVLPMKGVALAESIFESVADRPMGDIDLLALDDWNESVRVVEAAGLVAGDRADHAWVFRDADSGCDVELHHSITSCPGLFPFDASALWDSRIEASGQVKRRPSDEDLLVQLSLHAAFQHGLVLSLVQYLELGRLAARVANRERLQRATASSGAAVALSASLVVAAQLTGANLSDQVRWRSGRRLSRWLATRLQVPTQFLLGTPVPMIRVRWEVAAGRRARLLTGTLAPVAPGESPGARKRAGLAISRAARLARHWLG